MESLSAPVTPQPLSSSTSSPTASQTLRQSQSYTQPSTSSSTLPTSSSTPLASPTSSTSFTSHFPTLSRPHPTVDSSAALRALCLDSSALLSALSTQAVTDQLYSANQTVQSSMARIDECSTLITAFRTTNTQLHTTTLPSLLTTTNTTLPQLYTRIDTLTHYTTQLEHSVDALEQALAAAEAALASQRPGVSLGKLLSSFKRRSGKDDGGGVEKTWSEVRGGVPAHDYFNSSQQQQQRIPQS